MKTIQQVSEQTLKIENILNSGAPGEEFTYHQLENLSGVKMDDHGKNYMRTALKRLRMPYEVISGVGIRLLSPDNAMRIVTTKVVKIDNTVKRAEKTVRQVREKTYNELDSRGQSSINALTSFFGSIRMFSKSAKMLFKNEPTMISK